MNIVVQNFDGTRTAQRILDDLSDLHAFPWLSDVAVVSRNKLGISRVHSSWAQDSSNVSGGGAAGSLSGVLLGGLLGPAGALVGFLTGGALGSASGKSFNEEVSDPNLEELRGSLKKKSSALVLIGEFDEKFIALCANSNPTNVVRGVLTEDEVMTIKNSLMS